MAGGGSDEFLNYIDQHFGNSDSASSNQNPREQQQQQRRRRVPPVPKFNEETQQQQQQAEMLRMQQQQQQMVAPPEQLHRHNLALGSDFESLYVIGSSAQRLSAYISKQHETAGTNDLESWAKFVSEFFEPHARMRLCFSLYGHTEQSSIAVTTGMWKCQLCSQKPGYGYEISATSLPTIFKSKYDNGIVRELLHIDLPYEHQLSSGDIIVHYLKAAEVIVYGNLHVVRNGDLRVVFTPDLKIRSWEFCARSIEHLLPQSFLIPKTMELVTRVRKYQEDASNGSATATDSKELVAAVGDFAQEFVVPDIVDIGYPTAHVRKLEVLQVVNLMDLTIKTSIKHGTSPRETYRQLYGQAGTSSAQPNAVHQPDENQQQQQQEQQNVFAQDGLQTSYHNAAPQTNAVANANNDHLMTNNMSSAYAYAPASDQIPSVGPSMTPNAAQMTTPSPVPASQIPSAYALGNAPAQESSQPNETNQCWEF